MDNHKKMVLTHNLQKETFCEFGVSKVHGIGCFAVKDIPEKTNPFRKCNLFSFEKSHVFTEEELTAHLDESVIAFIKKLISPSDEGFYAIPANGMNSVNLSFYLNHSDSPNMRTGIDNASKTSYLSFFSLREIKKGEELFIDYRKEFGEVIGNKLLAR